MRDNNYIYYYNDRGVRGIHYIIYCYILSLVARQHKAQVLWTRTTSESLLDTMHTRELHDRTIHYMDQWARIAFVINVGF